MVLKLLSSAESLDGHGPGHGKAELRLYEPSLVAEVRVRTDDIVTAVSQAERELKVSTSWQADGIEGSGNLVPQYRDDISIVHGAGVLGDLQSQHRSSACCHKDAWPFTNS